MGHSLIEYNGNVALFSDCRLYLVRCFLLDSARRLSVTRPSSFLAEFIDLMESFRWLTTGVFSDLDLDSFIRGDRERLHLLLDLIDDSVVMVTENGPRLEPKLLNAVAASDGHDCWQQAVDTERLLGGCGAIANLVMGLPSVYWYGQPLSWLHDELTRRMKQERLTVHWKGQFYEQSQALEPPAGSVSSGKSSPPAR